MPLPPGFTEADFNSEEEDDELGSTGSNEEDNSKTKASEGKSAMSGPPVTA